MINVLRSEFGVLLSYYYHELTSLGNLVETWFSGVDKDGMYTLCLSPLGVGVDWFTPR